VACGSDDIERRVSTISRDSLQPLALPGRWQARRWGVVPLVDGYGGFRALDGTSRTGFLEGHLHWARPPAGLFLRPFYS
jgi:hypothetical protein